MLFEWLRFIIAAVLFIAGLFALLTTVIGIFRFKYVLNRIHVAAKCDTLGLLLILSSQIIMRGADFASLKLLLLIVFLWLSSPISSHLIAYLEVETNPNLEKECEVIHIDAD